MFHVLGETKFIVKVYKISLAIILPIIVCVCSDRKEKPMLRTPVKKSTGRAAPQKYAAKGNVHAVKEKASPAKRIASPGRNISNNEEVPLTPRRSMRSQQGGVIEQNKTVHSVTAEQSVKLAVTKLTSPTKDIVMSLRRRTTNCTNSKDENDATSGQTRPDSTTPRKSVSAVGSKSPSWKSKVTGTPKQTVEFSVPSPRRGAKYKPDGLSPIRDTKSIPGCVTQIIAMQTMDSKHKQEDSIDHALQSPRKNLRHRFEKMENEQSAQNDTQLSAVRDSIHLPPVISNTEHEADKADTDSNIKGVPRRLRNREVLVSDTETGISSKVSLDHSPRKQTRSASVDKQPGEGKLVLSSTRTDSSVVVSGTLPQRRPTRSTSVDQKDVAQKQEVCLTTPNKNNSKPLVARPSSRSRATDTGGENNQHSPDKLTLHKSAETKSATSISVTRAVSLSPCRRSNSGRGQTSVVSKVTVNTDIKVDLFKPKLRSVSNKDTADIHESPIRNIRSKSHDVPIIDKEESFRKVKKPNATIDILQVQSPKKSDKAKCPTVKTPTVDNSTLVSIRTPKQDSPSSSFLNMARTPAGYEAVYGYTLPTWRVTRATVESDCESWGELDSFIDGQRSKSAIKSLSDHQLKRQISSDSPNSQVSNQNKKNISKGNSNSKFQDEPISKLDSSKKTEDSEELEGKCRSKADHQPKKPRSHSSTSFTDSPTEKRSSSWAKIGARELAMINSSATVRNTNLDSSLERPSRCRRKNTEDNSTNRYASNDLDEHVHGTQRIRSAHSEDHIEKNTSKTDQSVILKMAEKVIVEVKESNDESIGRATKQAHVADSFVQEHKRTSSTVSETVATRLMKALGYTSKEDDSDKETRARDAQSVRPLRRTYNKEGDRKHTKQIKIKKTGGTFWYYEPVLESTDNTDDEVQFSTGRSRSYNVDSEPGKNAPVSPVIEKNGVKKVETKRVSRFWSYELVAEVEGQFDTKENMKAKTDGVRRNDEGETHTRMRLSESDLIHSSQSRVRNMEDNSTIRNAGTNQDANVCDTKKGENMNGKKENEKKGRKQRSRGSRFWTYEPLIEREQKHDSEEEQEMNTKKRSRGSRFWTYELVEEQEQKSESEEEEEQDMDMKKRQGVSRFWTYEPVVEAEQETENSEKQVQEEEHDMDKKKKGKSRFWTYEPVVESEQETENSKKEVQEEKQNMDKKKKGKNRFWSYEARVEPEKETENSEEEDKLNKKRLRNKTEKTKKGCSFWTYEPIVVVEQETEKGEEERRQTENIGRSKYKNKRKGGKIVPERKTEKNEEVKERHNEYTGRNQEENRATGSRCWTYELIVDPVETEKSKKKEETANYSMADKTRRGSKLQNDGNVTEPDKKSDHGKKEEISVSNSAVSSRRNRRTCVSKQSDDTLVKLTAAAETEKSGLSNEDGEVQFNRNSTNPKKNNRFWNNERDPESTHKDDPKNNMEVPLERKKTRAVASKCLATSSERKTSKNVSNEHDAKEVNVETRKKRSKFWFYQAVAETGEDGDDEAEINNAAASSNDTTASVHKDRRLSSEKKQRRRQERENKMSKSISSKENQQPEKTRVAASKKRRTKSKKQNPSDDSKDSWVALSNRSMQKLLRDSDEESFDGFHRQNSKSDLPSDVSYDEYEEVPTSDIGMDNQTNKQAAKDNKFCILGVDTFMSDFESKSDASWDACVEEYLDTTCQQQQADGSFVRRSPRKSPLKLFRFGSPNKSSKRFSPRKFLPLRSQRKSPRKVVFSPEVKSPQKSLPNASGVFSPETPDMCMFDVGHDSDVEPLWDGPVKNDRSKYAKEGTVYKPSTPKNDQGILKLKLLGETPRSYLKEPVTNSSARANTASPSLSSRGPVHSTPLKSKPQQKSNNHMEIPNITHPKASLGLSPLVISNREGASPGISRVVASVSGKWKVSASPATPGEGVVSRKWDVSSMASPTVGTHLDWTFQENQQGVEEVDSEITINFSSPQKKKEALQLSMSSPSDSQHNIWESNAANKSSQAAPGCIAMDQSNGPSAAKRRLLKTSSSVRKSFTLSHIPASHGHQPNWIKKYEETIVKKILPTGGRDCRGQGSVSFSHPSFDQLNYSRYGSSPEFSKTPTVVRSSPRKRKLLSQDSDTVRKSPRKHDAEESGSCKKFKLGGMGSPQSVSKACQSGRKACYNRDSCLSAHRKDNSQMHLVYSKDSSKSDPGKGHTHKKEVIQTAICNKSSGSYKHKRSTHDKSKHHDNSQNSSRDKSHKSSHDKSQNSSRSKSQNSSCLDKSQNSSYRDRSGSSLKTPGSRKYKHSSKNKHETSTAHKSWELEKLSKNINWKQEDLSEVEFAHNGNVSFSYRSVQSPKDRKKEERKKSHSSQPHKKSRRDGSPTRPRTTPMSPRRSPRKTHRSPWQPGYSNAGQVYDFEEEGDVSDDPFSL